MAHFVPGQRNLGAPVEDEIRNGWRRQQQRTRLPIVAQIGGGIDGHHAGHRPRHRRVDGLDARVGQVAAQKGHMQHPRQMDIVGKERASGQQPGILVAFDGLAEVTCCHKK